MLKIFEAFAGYGGGSFALKKLGVDFECVGYSEIDKNAVKCFELNHPHIKNFGDISKINPVDIPYFDLFLGGFPCQDVSIAGKRDLSKGRTNLYKEILRICAVKKPKMILLENVAGLLSMGSERKLIDKVVSDLKNIGYQVAWKKLNSKDFGIPQSRDRVWIVCFRDDVYEPFKFQFPIEEKLKIRVKDLLEDAVDKKYFLSEKAISRLWNNGTGFHSKINSDIESTLFSSQHKLARGRDMIRVFDSRKYMGESEPREYKDICPTLMERARTDESPIIVHSLMPRSDLRGKGGHGHLSKSDNTAYCLDTSNNQAIEIITHYGHKGKEAEVSELCPTLKANSHGHQPMASINSEIRRLTPRECFRLMGFLDDEINLNGLSDTAKYKLAGNGWEINLASKVLKNMLKAQDIV